MKVKIQTKSDKVNILKDDCPFVKKKMTDSICQDYN
jgi:hypothetical protein